MSLLTSTSITGRNRALDAALDGHTKHLDIYANDGARPSTPESGPGSATKLCRITFATASPWNPASSASKALPAGSYTGLGLANGTISWAAIVDTDGTTLVQVFNAGPSTVNLVFANSVSQIVTGATITLSSATVTQAQDA